jgi:site-specific recombinase XerD
VTALAPILQAYFTQRLAQRQASPHTVASYRDTFRLLLRFARQQLGTPPSRLDLTDVDAALVGAFLDHLETGRGNRAATRNNRLAAVHSLFSYALDEHVSADPADHPSQRPSDDHGVAPGHLLIPTLRRTHDVLAPPAVPGRDG